MECAPTCSMKFLRECSPLLFSCCKVVKL